MKNSRLLLASVAVMGSMSAGAAMTQPAARPAPASSQPAQSQESQQKATHTLRLTRSMSPDTARIHGGGYNRHWRGAAFITKGNRTQRARQMAGFVARNN